MYFTIYLQQEFDWIYLIDRFYAFSLFAYCDVRTAVSHQSQIRKKKTLLMNKNKKETLYK